jgi:uncharacterized protein (TIGR03435 family)
MNWLRFAGALAATCALLVAQENAPKFEAADVHVSPAGATESAAFLPHGRAEFRAVSFLKLVSVAYSVPEEWLLGGSPWMATERFDVTAKAGGKASAKTMEAMLQSLLVERFGLVLKSEEKAFPVYALVLRKAGVARKSSGSGEPKCSGGQEENVRTLTCRNTTIATLAASLRQAAPAYFDKPLEDRTEMKGAYDFRLEWVPRAQTRGAQSGMSIYNSIEKQLGIGVETQTTPMPVVRIESANRTPTPNVPNITELLGPAPTEFEVATIRPSRPEEVPDADIKNGVIEARGIPLREMIAFAYNVEEEWVKGGEKWVETERFDLTAKTAPTESDDTVRTLLLALLRERFHLKAHKEVQPVCVYALTAPKPKLKTADPSARPACRQSFPDGVRTLTCTNTTMAQFAEKLHDAATGYFDHPVADLTGLTGAYDFSVGWVGREGLQPKDGEDRPAGLTVFEAVDKQLGLKLAAQKHPMPVVVIDSVDRRPTEN